MTTFVHSVYTLILALWVGGISLFTFIVTPNIFRSYGRDAAGEIVGKLFPGYFIFTLVLSALALLALPLCKSLFGQTGYRWSLLLSVIAVAINVFCVFKTLPQNPPRQTGGPLISTAPRRFSREKDIPKTSCG